MRLAYVFLSIFVKIERSMVASNYKDYCNFPFVNRFEPASFNMNESLSLPALLGDSGQNTASDSQKTASKIRTEDTGIHLEQVLCEVLGIECKTKNKNNYRAEFREEAEMLIPRLRSLSQTHSFDSCRYEHTAAGGYPYDFTGTLDPTVRLSLKSAKHKDKAKIAPHTIGQANPDKFADFVGAQNVEADTRVLKQWIQENVVALLTTVSNHTFDCPVIYYNKGASSLQYITLREPIDWTGREYAWSCPYDRWNNSSTLKVRLPDGKYKAILEVQFHSKSRKNMAIRWAFDALLRAFSPYFNIDGF